VPDRVEDRDVEVAEVDGVVEAVPADLVRRLEQPGDGGAPDREGQRRQQRPLHLGRQVHVLAAAEQVRQVGVPAAAMTRCAAA
jgi:hypothetical protein